MTGPRLSIIPAAAAEDPAVSAPAYRLLGLLAAHADKKGYCYPSVARLAKKSGLGERWVKRLLNDLVATPYLTAAKRPGRSTVYQVITKGVVPQTTGPTDHPGVVPQVQKGWSHRPPITTLVTTNLTTPLIEMSFLKDSGLPIRIELLTLIQKNRREMYSWRF